MTFTLSALKADAISWVECPSASRTEIHFATPSARGQSSPIGLAGAGGGTGGPVGGLLPPLCITHNWQVGWYGPGATHEGTLRDDLRPPSIPSDAWAAIWENLSTNIGPEWGHYVARVADDLTFLQSIGQTVTDATKLWNYEVAKASAALSPVQVLASAVDVATPAPGLPLKFHRIFGQSIDSRYRLGPLGRGWMHNWDIQAQSQANGTVVLRGPGGVERLFSRDRDGNYVPSPGDYGKLSVTSSAYRLIETDKTLWQFRSDSFLDFVQDSNGNRITLSYTGSQLTAISHSNGKQLLLQYNSTGRIVSVTDPVGPTPADDRVATFAYDDSGETLLTATAPGNRVTTYNYDLSSTLQRSHALLSITFPDGTHTSQGGC